MPGGAKWLSATLIRARASEAGTPWIVSLIDPAHDNRIVTIRLTAPEFVSALFRRVRLGQIKEMDADLVVVDFRDDWQAVYRVLDVTESVTDRAMVLARAYGLRGYDAVHLAAALEVRDLRQALGAPLLTFVSTDIDHLRAAEGEGLRIDNPHDHV